MTKISIRLDTRRKLRDGTYPLKIAIARGKSGRTIYLSLDVSLHREDWDVERQVIIGKNVPNKAVLSSYIRQRFADAESRIMKLQLAGTLRSYTDKALLSYLKNEEENEEPHLFKTSYEQFIALKENNGTKLIYNRTYNLVSKFSDINNLLFEEMTVKWLNDFKIFLRQYCKSKNGTAICLRNIRAIFNFAISQGTITCYPFRTLKIESQATEKRSLSIDKLKKIINLELVSVSKPQRKYLDCFKLTFFLIGINSADLAQLKEIKDGRVEYIRKKTGKPYSIKVEPEALAIINRYRGKDHLLSWFDNRNSYFSFAKWCNKELGEIGKTLGIENLTLYWARHSWATIAYELDVPDDTISRALGHSQTSGAAVTQIYIRTDRHKVDEANRKVIDFVTRIDLP